MHTTETTTEGAAPEFRGSATYCPEDNKLRLYVGRVPREDYLKLRAAGWVATPKQREAGGCDFVAPWTPERRDLCLEWCGSIEDEDQSPAERAADRAERFAGYRDKRTDEATGHADRYDAGPSVHGFQSQARAERAAARHDRIADRAGDAWGKAEYWTRRTAGVISHALYRSAPGVRMGRIKTLEAELRRVIAAWERRGEALSDYAQDWKTHYEMRLAYENQMLDAVGGRLAHIEIEVGGWIVGGRFDRERHQPRQIIKVNKSPVTGRVVSVLVRDNHPSSVNHWGNPYPDGVTKTLCHTIETERMSPDAYRAPTPEERAAFLAAEKSAKAERKKTAPAKPPLINPTDEDAERLQALWNAHALAEREAAYKRCGYTWAVNDCPSSTVLRVTQAQYSAHSKGTYTPAGTRKVYAGGYMGESYYNADEKQRAKYGPEVCMVRQNSNGNYSAHRVIVLTDKPQKPLPAAVWQKPTVAALVNTSESLATP